MCMGKNLSYLARKAQVATSRWMSAVARRESVETIVELRRVAILRRRAAGIQ